ncbi:MAG: transposase [Cryobacterium sp.]|nr:transposase [Oligoflexia bacterium]
MIYDRLYFGVRLVKAHYRRGNHFLFRLKKNANREIAAFFQDPARPTTATFMLGEKFEVNLVRIFDAKNRRHDVFATSLPIDFLKPHLIAKLYRLRWEVETSFLELTGITKAEQWHSKSVNGILQELYAKFWLINYTKLQIHAQTQKPRGSI